MEHIRHRSVPLLPRPVKKQHTHLRSASIFLTENMSGQGARAFLLLAVNVHEGCRTPAASSASSWVQSSRQELTGWCCHFPSDKAPSQTGDIRFSLWAVSLFDAKLPVHAVYSASHFQGFARRSNSASAVTALHIRRWKPWYLFCPRHACLCALCGFHQERL